MGPEHVFLLVWFILVMVMIFIFLIRGRKAIEIFPKSEGLIFEYSENFASGHSTQSVITQMGSARKILRIRITADELWIKTNILMASIAERFDLLHLIPIRSLKSVKREGKSVSVEFKKSGEVKKILLISKTPNVLVRLLNDKMNARKII